MNVAYERSELEFDRGHPQIKHHGSSDLNQPQSELQFGCFDPDAELEITQAALPHWFQAGVAMFVTFRTDDSLPAEVIRQFEDELSEWLHRQNLPIALAKAQGDLVKLTQQLLATGTATIGQIREFKRMRDCSWHRKLDELHGECLLRNPELAQIVGDAVRFYDGNKYDLDRIVVMPNHVHALVQFRKQGESRELISQSWLRYSARMINVAVGRKGEFWQGEPFDHLVRSPQQFTYLQRYIESNPQQAHLSAGSYFFWHR